MKTKKVLRKLNKVEALLSDVMERFAGSRDGLENMLGAAKVSVGEAIKTFSSSTNTRKPRSSDAAGNRRLSAEGRRRISLAAKKRWAAAKRKGVNAVTGRRLSKTA